jgi:protein O-GlcNAc transferase
MRIFNRFSFSSPDASDSSIGNANISEQEATRLIGEGQALEANGRLDEAMQCYLDAIQLAPNPARAHLNHGNVLLLKGDLKGALDAFNTAIKHKPDYAGAYYNIGNALLNAGKPDDAIASYRRALEIQPDYAEVHCSMGVALNSLGKFDEAIASYHAALKINPDFSEAHCNRGLALQAIGRFDDAMTCYLRASEINPGFAEAHFYLGNGLFDLRHFDSAAECYRRALKIKPGFAEAHLYLGNALQAVGQLVNAAESYRQALEIKPGFAEAHLNLGIALQGLGEPGRAAENFRQALALQPDNAMFRLKSAFSLPVAPQTITASVAVPAGFDAALQELSDWLSSSTARQESFSKVAGSMHPFHLAYRNGNHVALLSRYGDLVAGSSARIPVASGPRRNKIRLAIVSNHFYRHSVWDIIVRGLLTNLDRTRFEVVLYNTDKSEDGETKLAKSLCDIWRDPRTITGPDGWLDAMAEDRPDVIYYPEIGMDPVTLRLAVHRLAPLQVAGWGHPITTGLPTVDIFFSGEMIEAPDADSHYRERLVRLPGTGCCTEPIPLIPEPIPDLAAELSRRRGPRFVIPQMIFKFDPADDALFANIASTVGECTFILLSKPKYSFATDQLIIRLNRTFQERNLDPKDYLLVIPWLSLEKFYSLLDMCDIYLDCPSFSGYTTAWQALQRGLPVLTLEGKYMRQRLAAGLLRKIGMTDTIASNSDEYVTIAVQLTTECNNPVIYNARRKALAAAAHLANHDISAVKGFERSVIGALSERGLNFES